MGNMTEFRIYVERKVQAQSVEGPGPDIEAEVLALVSMALPAGATSIKAHGCYDQTQELAWMIIAIGPEAIRGAVTTLAYKLKARLDQNAILITESPVTGYTI